MIEAASSRNGKILSSFAYAWQMIAGDRSREKRMAVRVSIPIYAQLPDVVPPPRRPPPPLPPLEEPQRDDPNEPDPGRPPLPWLNSHR